MGLGLLGSAYGLCVQTCADAHQEAWHRPWLSIHDSSPLAHGSVMPGTAACTVCSHCIFPHTHGGYSHCQKVFLCASDSWSQLNTCSSWLLRKTSEWPKCFVPIIIAGTAPLYSMYSFSIFHYVTVWCVCQDIVPPASYGHLEKLLFLSRLLHHPNKKTSYCALWLL